jgi:hypothetical protein
LEDPLKSANTENEKLKSFSQGKNNIFEDELSDTEGGENVRGFEKSKSIKNHFLFIIFSIDIDKLLRLQLFESKYHDEVGKIQMEKGESEVIKNKFDRRVYLLDTYKTILQKIKGFDYRYPKSSDNIDTEDTNDLDTSADTISTAGD